jgi:hypothetical protein
MRVLQLKIQLTMEIIMHSLFIRVFKMIYISKIHSILVEKAKESETDIDDKFVITLLKFIESL